MFNLGISYVRFYADASIFIFHSMMLSKMVVTSAIVQNSTLSIAHYYSTEKSLNEKGFYQFLSIPITQFTSFHSLSYLFHQSNDFHPTKIFTQVFVSVSNDADRGRGYGKLMNVLQGCSALRKLCVGKILLIKEL